MSMPTDRESLLASWKAIGPSQPFPHEAQEILLAYFKHARLHGEQILPAPQEQIIDSSPPTRFVRQPRANKKLPSGPVEVANCSSFEETLSCTSQKVQQPPAADSNRTAVTSHCEVDPSANGRRDEDIH
jgi:hypothetical protein